MTDDDEWPEDDPPDPRGRRPGYMPTPEEIADACRVIRSGWDAHEYEKRAPHLKFGKMLVPTGKSHLAEQTPG